MEDLNRIDLFLVGSLLGSDRRGLRIIQLVFMIIGSNRNDEIYNYDYDSTYADQHPLLRFPCFFLMIEEEDELLMVRRFQFTIFLNHSQRSYIINKYFVIFTLSHEFKSKKCLLNNITEQAIAKYTIKIQRYKV